MGKVIRLETEGERILRAVSETDGISFGTHAPFSFTEAGFARIGFADIPVVGCVAHCRKRDIGAVVPSVRSHLMRAAKAAGCPTHALSVRVTIGTESRERLFTDANPASASCGKRKRGAVVRCHLEIIDIACWRDFETKLPSVYL